MTELISKGGPLVWLLMACLGFSVAIFLERLSYYHRASMNIGEFLAGLAALIRRKNYAEALQECVATRVPAGRVIHAALLRQHAPRDLATSARRGGVWPGRCVAAPVRRRGGCRHKGRRGRCW